MKKLLSILVLVFYPIISFGQTILPENLVEIKNGNISDNTLIASRNGEVFIEFSKETKFVVTDGQVNFTGEILPPQVIDLEVRNPRGLMERLATFELVSNTGVDVSFIDRLDKRSMRNKFRESKLNSNGLNRSSWVKLIFPLPANSNLPAVWEWQGSDEGWQKIGGNVTTSSTEKVQILSSIIRRTGIYAIIEANPNPKNFADEYEISPREPLYTSNNSEGKTTTPSLIEEKNNNQISQSTEEKTSGFHSAGTVPEEIEIPSINNSSHKKELADLQTKVIENTEKIKNNPKMETKINELFSLISEKILEEKEIDQKKEKITEISLAVSKAETPEEKANLEKTFSETQTALFELEKSKKDPAKNQLYLKLKEEVNSFLTENFTQDLTANIIDRNPPEISDPIIKDNNNFYIPKNAILPQSGGKEHSSLSWPFPVFLLICFALLSWTIFSEKIKNA